jgi:hypothetical protein
VAIAATDAGAPYGPTPRRHSGATTEHAACQSPAQETSRAATTSPPCPSFASPAPPRSPPTTSARHRRSDPSEPHRSPAPKRGASDGLMRGDHHQLPVHGQQAPPEGRARRTLCRGDAGTARNGASPEALGDLSPSAIGVTFPDCESSRGRARTVRRLGDAPLADCRRRGPATVVDSVVTTML